MATACSKENDKNRVAIRTSGSLLKPEHESFNSSAKCIFIGKHRHIRKKIEDHRKHMEKSVVPVSVNLALHSCGVLKRFHRFLVWPWLRPSGFTWPRKYTEFSIEGRYEFVQRVFDVVFVTLFRTVTRNEPQGVNFIYVI